MITNILFVLVLSAFLVFAIIASHQQFSYCRSPQRGEAVECRIKKSRPSYNYQFFYVEWKDAKGKWHQPGVEIMEMTYLTATFKTTEEAEKYIAWATGKD